MPQFDIVVYSNELIWIFVFFFVLYSFNYLFFFPRIVEILKTRKKKVEKDLMKLEFVNKKVNYLFNFKENNVIKTLVLPSFSNFVSFCSVIGILNHVYSLNDNLNIKYYLNCYYNYFDFYELENI